MSYATDYTLRKNQSTERCPVRFCRNKRAKDKALCHTHHSRSWRKRNPLTAAYFSARSHAKARNIQFTLSLEQFAQFAGATGYLNGSGTNGHNLHIDRIDATKGYVEGNIQVLTCSENSRKRWVDWPGKSRQDSQSTDLDATDETDMPF